MQKDAAAAGRRIEIGKKRRDARRAGEESRHAAIRAGGVAFAERDVAVRVHEAARLRCAEEREPERHREFRRVVVLKRQPSAERRPEPGRDRRHVVAGPVARELQMLLRQVEDVGANDDVADVLDDGDLADIGRISLGGGGRLSAAVTGRRVHPEAVQHAPLRVRIELRPRLARRRRPQAARASASASASAGAAEHGSVGVLAAESAWMAVVWRRNRCHRTRRAPAANRGNSSIAIDACAR